MLYAGTSQGSAELHALLRNAAAGEPGTLRLRGADGIGLSLLVTPVKGRGGRRPGAAGLALVALRRDDAPPGLDAARLMRLFGSIPA